MAFYVDPVTGKVTCYDCETPAEKVKRLEREVKEAEAALNAKADLRRDKLVELAEAREAAKPKKTRGSEFAERVVTYSTGHHVNVGGRIARPLSDNDSLPKFAEHMRNGIAEAYAAAIDAERADAAKQEREACAEVAYKYANRYNPEGGTGFILKSQAQDIAAAIRART
jgi:hypothetical protein